jgi:RimJ/RimL family protein N-acetyltransferase
MELYPELRTARLILRQFSLEDAPEVQRLVGEWEVARPLLIVPHPYEDGMAQEWIATHRPAYEAGERVTWAVALREEGALVGSITLHLHPLHDNAELGYWIGKPYWGCGYATESTPHTCETLGEQPRLGQGNEEGGDEPRGREAGALQEVGNLRGPGGLRTIDSRLAQEQTRVAYTELLRTASRNCPKRFAGACGVALRATETVLFGSF